jgi:CheY-like chemotaxis protein
MSSEARAPVTRLRPIRVLVFGRDVAFVRVATLLLERSGHSVCSTASRTELRSLTRVHRPDVVLVDSTDSAAAAAAAVSLLETVDKEIPVIVVYEGEFAPPEQSVRLLPKWGNFEDVLEEIERLFSAA